MRTISKRLTLRIMMVVLATMAVIASVVYFTVGKYMEDEAMQRFQIVVMREYREIQRKLSDVYVANINSVHRTVVRTRLFSRKRTLLRALCLKGYCRCDKRDAH